MYKFWFCCVLKIFKPTVKRESNVHTKLYWVDSFVHKTGDFLNKLSDILVIFKKMIGAGSM